MWPGPSGENGVIIVGSRHNRGAAVDVSLVDAAGNDLEMPTDYDDFSDKARPDWDGTSDTAKKKPRPAAQGHAGRGIHGLSHGMVAL